MFGDLKRRVARLQRSAGLIARRACRACGGPAPGCTTMAFVHDGGGPLFGACAECGLALGPDGRAMHAELCAIGERPPTKHYHASVWRIIEGWDAADAAHVTQAT